MEAHSTCAASVESAMHKQIPGAHLNIIWIYVPLRIHHRFDVEMLDWTFHSAVDTGVYNIVESTKLPNVP